MSHHSHPKHDSHERKKSHPTGSSGGKPHMKIGMIIAVVLMLIALAVYVFTNDESNVPGESLQPTVPAGP